LLGKKPWIAEWQILGGTGGSPVVPGGPPGTSSNAAFPLRVLPLSILSGGPPKSAGEPPAPPEMKCGGVDQTARCF
jgi:hypothetical protein